jgi:Lipid A 3-O-deacylase (PagL)
MLAVLATSKVPADAAEMSWVAPRLEVSAGTFGLLDGATPLAMGLEYRWGAFGRWSIVPGAGLAAGDDDSRYVYGNLSRDFPVGRTWTATISFGAGYFHEGSEVQLGHPLIFQSGIELGRWIDQRWRIGLAFDHLSNAGLSDHNPGTEMLVLRVSMPLGGTGTQPSVDSAAADSDAGAVAASWRSSSRRISSPARAR